MDRATARARLGRMTASQTRPVLSIDDLDDLLDQVKRRDDAGRAPADTGWTGAYDLDLAAALGWEAKAAAVAADYTFSADGASYNKSDVLKNLQSLAKMYRGRSSGSIGSISLTNQRDLDEAYLLTDRAY